MEHESDDVLEEIENTKKELRSLREKQIVLEAKLRKLISEYYMMALEKIETENTEKEILV